MNITVVMIVVAGILVLAWVSLAYAMGRYFGRQEQMLDDLKRQHQVYRTEIRRKQVEMEEDWHAYYTNQEAQTQEEVKQVIDYSNSTLQVPERIDQIREATYKRASK